MTLQISDIGAVLKKVIVPRIQTQLPKEVLLLDQIKKNVGTTIANNNIYVAARVGRHSGIYAVAEGTEPRTGKAAYAQPYTAMKYCFGSLELTDQAIEAAKNGDEKAVAAILATEIQALKDDFKLDINRMLHGAGTGKLCLVNGTGTTTTTVTVDSNPNGGDGTEYISAGGYVSIGGGTAVQVSAVVSSTVFTIASAQSFNDNAVITRADADEPMGLAGIIDDGDNVATTQNILRSANPWANSHTDDTGEVLSEADMISIYTKTRRYGGAKACLMGETMYNKYGALLLSLKKTADLKEVLSGGWKGLEFMGGQCPVILDFDTWSGYVQFVNFDALTLAEMSSPFSWLEADAYGGILKRSASNRTIWEGTLKYYFNLVALNYKSHGRLSGKTAS